MIRYSFKSFFGKIVCSGRFLVIILFFAFVTGFESHTFMFNLKTCGENICPLEIIPYFMTVKRGMFLYYIFFILLVCIYPMYDGCMMEVARMGKNKWFCQQLLYVVFTSVLQSVVFSVSYILMLIPVSVWKNSWSDCLVKATEEQGFIDGIMQIIFVHKIYEWLNPVAAYVICLMLNILCSIFLGMVMIVLGICFKKVIAICVAGVAVFYFGFVENGIYMGTGVVGIIYDFFIEHLYPIRHAALGYIEGYGDLAEAVVYFAVGICIIWIVGRHAVSGQDFAAGTVRGE